MNDIDETRPTDGLTGGPEEGTGWVDMFRGIRGVYTILLNVGG